MVKKTAAIRLFRSLQFINKSRKQGAVHFITGLAGFMDKLKSTKEADGSSLFDHTSLAFGSNISSIHYLDNCPTLLAGGGANLKLGEHLVLSKDTPLCNVWLTMLHGLGIQADRHGDSTGVVKELQA